MKKTLDQCYTCEEVENYRVAKIQELKEARNNRNVIRNEKLILQKQIIELQSKKKDLEIAESKANNVISTLNADIELAKTKYWSLRNT